MFELHYSVDLNEINDDDDDDDESFRRWLNRQTEFYS